jgi:hypothetical protein
MVVNDCLRKRFDMHFKILTRSKMALVTTRLIRSRELKKVSITIFLCINCSIRQQMRINSDR